MTRADITLMLRDLDLSNAAQVDQLLTAVYEELRALAASQMKKERPGHTLQPTALVHEPRHRPT